MVLFLKKNGFFIKLVVGGGFRGRESTLNCSFWTREAVPIGFNNMPPGIRVNSLELHQVL